jgi:hypothetical protein
VTAAERPPGGDITGAQSSCAGGDAVPLVPVMAIFGVRQQRRAVEHLVAGGRLP